ncbi:hypothetical protein PFICI_05347 [Pestalotiopsis fici W106-1]|uniref:Uncharacterized protein n=1 Tax=Pestalotiopsis fici (strain W106-1 / CGMCC3.15140) TaxID=1229662 RepID=W3XE39_PESFW|nr:uncharacterized protein PFICI_05347 [Pestalotiopsis fici W106-1]ETS83471.1 hypothetical protein PFICI_05347 [Pestalotiopsis fici W106-1]
MSRRTVLSAGNGAFEAASRRIPQHASRSFSSTASNAAVITQFQPTSSPELDTALSTIREKIILPSYLTVQQRKRIISPKWAKKLQADPITVEIDGEIFKFRHMNPFSGEIPNTRRSVIEAIKKFDGTSDDDFKNLRPLIEGVYGAGRQLGNGFYAKVLRVVGDKGRVAELMDLARSKKTGFRLDTSEKVNELLHFIQLNALESGWNRAETEQALRWAEHVIEMVQDEAAHAPQKRIEGDLPLNRDPQVLLAPLHLAAALIVKGGVKDHKTVTMANKLASTIVKLWPAGRGLRQIHPVSTYIEDNQRGYLLEANKFVAMASPLLHGLGLASQAVTEPTLAAELKTRYERLEEEVKSSLSEAAKKGKSSRGQAVYQKFFGGSA